MSLAHVVRRGLLTCLKPQQLCRHMSSNRNHPVEGGSNETGITEEVRDLIRNMKSAENLEDWQVDPSLGSKVTVDTWSPNKREDIDNDQEGVDMVYWPHKGQEWPGPEEAPPPLVLLVEKVVPESGEPWWIKEALEKLGLLTGCYHGKRVAVPNMTHYTSLIYKVKHLVRVVPVSFPNGVPSEDEFDPQMAKMTDNGEFVYHPKVKAHTEAVEAGIGQGDMMLIQRRTVQKKAFNDYKFSRDSPMGNSNYDRDSRILNPKLSNRVTDAAHKIKY